MDALKQFLQSAATALQVVIVVLLILGPLRRYLGIFLYCVASLATTILEGWLELFHGGSSTPLFRQVYFADQVGLDFLLYSVVIALAFQSMTADSPLRKVAPKVFGVIILLSAVLPFVLFHESGVFSLSWFRRTSQVLTFGVALANLLFWAALLTNRKRDPRLLGVAISFGISLGGEAIAWGFRSLLGQRSPMYAFTNLTTFLLAQAILCKTFWPTGQKAEAAASSNVDGSTTIDRDLRG
jgi:hypothetical protein